MNNEPNINQTNNINQLNQNIIDNEQTLLEPQNSNITNNQYSTNNNNEHPKSKLPINATVLIILIILTILTILIFSMLNKKNNNNNIEPTNIDNEITTTKINNHKAKSYEMKWGTSAPVIVRDKDNNSLTITMKGDCTYSTAATYNNDIEDYMLNAIQLKVSTEAYAIISSLSNVSSDHSKIVEYLEQEITNYTLKYGEQEVVITKFKVSDISIKD